MMQSNYDLILMEYAAGTLDEATSLVISAHAALSPYARRRLDRFDGLGGLLLENCCGETPMAANALEKTLARLSEHPAKTDVNIEEEDAGCFLEGLALPSCFKAYVQEAHWQTIYPGMAIQTVDTVCTKSRARLLKVDPGVKTPEHSHRGREITLMLDGAFHDESGTYSRGDLIIVDEDFDFTHQPVADARTGCICLVVTTAPIKLTGWKRLFNPFLKN